MQRQIWKDYFSFTKKERRAVIVLVALIFVVFLLPRLVLPDDRDRELTIKNLAGQLPLEGTDSVDRLYADADRSPYHKPAEASDIPVPPRELFYFDPNSLPDAGWRKLGLRDKTIATIRNYLAKGGKFRQKGDFGKIYGLRPDEAERLLPYIRLPESTANMVALKPYGAGSRPPPIYKVPSYKSIDLNSADTTALIALPGIGPTLAARILHFRDKLGGFYSVDQLKEVYGLPDSTLQRVQSRLLASGGKLQKLNINTAGVDSLKSHPYIRWNIANAVVQYRAQHGPFQTVDAIQAVAIITPDVYRKLSPYLTVD